MATESENRPDKRKGFSGLSSLVSDIESPSQSAGTEGANPVSSQLPNTPSQLGTKPVASSPPKPLFPPADPASKSSAGKWILGIAIAMGAIWFVNEAARQPSRPTEDFPPAGQDIALTAAQVAGQESARKNVTEYQPTEPLSASPHSVAVASVTLGNAISRDLQVVVPMTTFRLKDTIYVSVGTEGTSSAAVLTALWTYGDGQLVNRSSQTIAPAGPSITEFHISKPDGWPIGNYQVEIMLDGKHVRSVPFSVSAIQKATNSDPRSASSQSVTASAATATPAAAPPATPPSHSTWIDEPQQQSNATSHPVTNSDSGLVSGTDGATYRVPSSRVAELDEDKREAKAAQQDAQKLSAQVDRQKPLLDDEKRRVDQAERQLDALDSEIEQQRLLVDSSNQYEIDSFNSKIHEYNSHRTQLQRRINQFNIDVDTYNALVQRAQAQERRANQLVDIYNSKLEKYGTRQ